MPVAVVTGASSGIGRATAIALARAGFDVVVHHRRSPAQAADVARDIESLGQKALVLSVDLTEPVMVELVQRAWDWQGAVDAWINNAGADVLTGEQSRLGYEDKLRLLLEIDVIGTVRLSHLVGPKMKARGQGSIVNVGWDQAETGMAGESGELFAATKGAIMAFTRSLSASLAPEVRVNCVAPGWIRTAWGENASQAWQDRARRESLLLRWGTPEDVAQVIRFLVSEEASFVTGQILPVNGGIRRAAEDRR